MRPRLLLCALALCALAACGGGGGGDDDNEPTPQSTYDVGAAFRNFLTTSATWEVSGTGSDKRSYNLVVSIAPAAEATFELTGESGTRSIQTAAVSQDGVSLVSGTSMVYFKADTLALLGSSSDEGTCSRDTSGPALPATARPGDGGVLYTSVDYAGCTSGSAQEGTSSTDWSVEEDDGLVFFCMKTTTREGSSVVTSIETDCLQIDEDGELGTKAKIVLEIPGELTIEAGN